MGRHARRCNAGGREADHLTRQLTFGAGTHFCLGANLAKVVLESAFRELPSRFPNLELACEPEAVGWDYETFYGIISLPVVAR